MDGLVTLRGLREVAPSARVVILSAFIEREREAEALRLGAEAVLAKPPELQKLLRFLHETLRRDDPSGNSPSPQASRASWTR
jgi:DNA-binding response OmpR family regulator